MDLINCSVILLRSRGVWGGLPCKVSLITLGIINDLIILT